MAGVMSLKFALHYSGRLVVIFGVLIGTGSVGRCDICCPPKPYQYNYKSRQYQLNTIQSSALIGSVYRNQTTKTVARCASACLKDDSCKSFNYFKDEELCQLNSAVKTENSTALQSSGRFSYFEDKVRHAWTDAPSQVAGSLKHVSIGESGVWGVDSQDQIFYREWCGCSWTLITDGGLKQLDVGRNVVWGVRTNDQIFYRKVSTGNAGLTSWINVAGSLKHVSVSQKGHVWGVNRNNDIFHRLGASENQVAGSAWKHIAGTLLQISIGSGGVWGIHTSYRIFYRGLTYGDPDTDPDGVGWYVAPAQVSLKYVSSGDVVYVVDTNDAIYYRVGTSAESPTGTAWRQIDGNLKQIESISSTFWGVDAENNIYTNDSY